MTPFNFTSIAGNLPTAPALMGNTVVWKPASSAMLERVLHHAAARGGGAAAGRHQLRARRRGDDLERAARAPRSRRRALHRQHRRLQQHVADDRREHRRTIASYPRIVGETGGKDFIVAHPSADPQALAVAIARGGFEYQGQKCSAASRIYVPKSLWPEVRDRIVAHDRRSSRWATSRDFRNFMGAVIDGRRSTRSAATSTTRGRTRRSSPAARRDDSDGYFIAPTLVETDDPGYRLLCEEIFGPVVTAHVYDDAKWERDARARRHDVAVRADGRGVRARPRAPCARPTTALRNAAGNFYINDKPTGAVVGQQPFGGARGSGTNDKAGSKLNLVRWVSARSMKETFSPPTRLPVPFMAGE